MALSRKRKTNQRLEPDPLTKERSDEERRAFIEEELKRAVALMPRFEALSEILGEPKDKRSRLFASRFRSVIRNHLDEYPELSLETPASVFTDEQRSEISKFAELGTRDRRKVFSKLLHSEKLSNDLSVLTKSYLDFPHNEGVKKRRGRGGSVANVALPFNDSGQRPRWAEENRPGVRFPMRLSTNLIEEVDRAAQSSDQTRTEWFVDAMESFLNQSYSIEPPDSPEYKSTRPVSFRLDEELNNKIKAAAERFGLKKTEWARRVIRATIAGQTPSVELVQEP